MKIRTEIDDQRIIYPLAKIWIRLLTRTLDSIIVIGISLGIYFLVSIGKSSLSFGAIVLITFSLAFVIFFIYYILIAFFTKGSTLFRWIFKIKLIELINHKKYFWHLLVHDLFIWINYMIIMIVFSIITITQPEEQQENFFSSLFVTQNDLNYIFIIFRIFFSINGIISIVFLVYNSINNGKRSIQDLMSWTAMISLNKGTPENPNQNKAPSEWKSKKELNLPGHIHF